MLLFKIASGAQKGVRIAARIDLKSARNCPESGSRCLHSRLQACRLACPCARKSIANVARKATRIAPRISAKSTPKGFPRQPKSTQNRSRDPLRAPLGHPIGYQGIPGASWGVPRGARRDPGGTLGTPWGRLGVSPGPRRHASGPPRRPFRDPVAPKTRVVRAICCAIRFTSALGAIFGNFRAMSGRFPGRFSSAFDTAGGVVVDSLRKGPTLTKHRK
jgi:hypothetical protein